ncbi:MAG: hypothetical protein GW809_04575 [Bacteroidetes bacterium]|nr:hypothetical protein [Bacteroidota bacterium]
MLTLINSLIRPKRSLAPEQTKTFISSMNAAVMRVDPYAIAAVLKEYGLFNNVNFHSFYWESPEHFRQVLLNEYPVEILERWLRDDNCTPLHPEDFIQGVYVQYKEQQEFITYTKVISMCVYYRIRNERIVGLQWCK